MTTRKRIDVGVPPEITPEIQAYAEERVAQALKHRDQQDWAERIEGELQSVHKAIQDSNHIKEKILEPVAKITQDIEHVRKQADALERTVGYIRSDDFIFPTAKSLAERLHIPVYQNEDQVNAAIAFAELSTARQLVERRRQTWWDRVDSRTKVIAAGLGMVATVSGWVATAWVASSQVHNTPAVTSPSPSPSSTHHP